ncbi:YncE family protein [Qipengyuania vesicularis]|uniref:Vgb family protein n=1 Tax=Qipengyuania vesicularis TaxID=2867232 RepID=UPI001C879647|nr:YncE family protein [Qipengyuania vesicularis]MBX7526386.1 YncE family protein [Qipengyuania vesicularis]
MRTIALIAMLCAACAPTSSEEVETPASMVEVKIAAPGFVDFLTVDQDNVWVTNTGRVELWGVSGKRAEVEIPRPCGTMAALDGKLFAANCEGANLYRIDMASAEVEAVIETGVANPDGETNVVAGAGSIWIPSNADGRIARVDPSTNTVIAEIEVVPGTYFLAFGFDRLWAVSSDRQLLQRIDPASDSVTGTAELGNQPGFLAAGEGGVWVQEQKDGTVARVDPDSMALVGRTKVGESLLWGDIDTAKGSVWLRTTEDQTFVQIDAETGEILERFGEPVGSGAIRATPYGVWTSAHDVERISWWGQARD